ncbi:AGAP010680-PA-like protein [Anopheles sinensis]|uniref:AGAP010680-PA-like protein n=1 Tax=Anopheles sinensis TaxID=74873 RepID=A0A084WUG1_ANOSI|nr:AGAP010680-PA-like protein [Anopheles sinensis]
MQVTVSPANNAKENLSWLTNQSFIPLFASNEEAKDDSSSEDIREENVSQGRDDTGSPSEKDRLSKKRKKKHIKKHKKKRGKRRSRSASSSEHSESSSDTPSVGQASVRISEAEYYTDVDPLKIYLTVEKLHRPACPRYRLATKRPLGAKDFNRKGTSLERHRRYYRVSRKETSKEGAKQSQEEILSREETLERSLRTDETVDKWIELIRYRQEHPIHLDSYQNHKRELSLVERARRHFPADDRLLHLYLDAIVRVHPTDEVLDLIRRAIVKDETNVTLWGALIRNKQCAMAQCIVPDVLKLYEKSTRSLFMARRSDETMLQLFKNCATFCRQAGLNELMFGMVQLAVSMNVGGRFASEGGGLFSSPEHFPQLIEYEELILRSGLPMNEIWLRVELLRSAFQYLPFAGTARLTSDPQRMVLNDDVIGFVYPLINKRYSFELTLTVLRLLKFPFASSLPAEDLECFREEPYESDYSEQLLPLLLDVYRNCALDHELYALIKQLSVAPSYIGANLAHESYVELVQQFLTIAIDHFEGTQSAIFLILYLQLQRMLVASEKIGARELGEGKIKAIRARVKNVLKHTHSSNQNNLLVYAEYGLLEYEMTGITSGTCRKIFTTSVQVYCSNREEGQNNSTEDDIDTDLFALVLTMVDMLLVTGRKVEAVEALTNLVLSPDKLNFEGDKRETSTMEPPDTVKLSTLQKLNERVNRGVRKETELGAAPLTVEQHLQPNGLLGSIKAYVIYLALVRSSLSEAIKQLETFLYLFNEPTNPRHRYLRNGLYRIYLQLFQIGQVCGNRAGPTHQESIRTFLDVADRTLGEFPSCLYILQSVIFNPHLPWFSLRHVVGQRLTPKGVLLLVVAARYRASLANQADQTEEIPYKRRILNLLGGAVKSPVSFLHQNALLWRLYLRELFDQPNAPPGVSVLDQCRRTLYAALEACPWNKALYLDGSTCAPQELSALLDLMMEKQLRVHAIPEELAILRDE